MTKRSNYSFKTKHLSSLVGFQKMNHYEEYLMKATLIALLVIFSQTAMAQKNITLSKSTFRDYQIIETETVLRGLSEDVKKNKLENVIDNYRGQLPLATLKKMIQRKLDAEKVILVNMKLEIETQTSETFSLNRSSIPQQVTAKNEIDQQKKKENLRKNFESARIQAQQFLFSDLESHLSILKSNQDARCWQTEESTFCKEYRLELAIDDTQRITSFNGFWTIVEQK